MDQPKHTTAEQVKPKSKLKRFAGISFLIIIFAFVIFYLICGMAYSEGTRSGILTKVSKKGYVFKTYEGELNIGGINQGEGTIIPLTIFKFSTTKKQVYDSLEIYQGRKVVLKYRQVIKNFFWQGDSDYFVDHVSLVK
jgi:hypothetical protein